MSIVSVSVPEELLKDVESAGKQLGFKGRSKTFRAALVSLIEEAEQSNKLKGIVDAVLVVVHFKKNEPEITKLKHIFGRILKSQLHNCINENTCLEVFVLKGDAEKITALANRFRTNKNVKYSKLILAK
jgi:CopG family nickel-responsive transcriptional regulator